MTARTRLTLAIAAGVVVVVSVVAIVIGGHHSGPTDTGRGTDSGAATLGPQPEGASPATAATMALSAMFSWRPATDTSPGDGLTRALPYLTGQLAAEATAPPATGVRPLHEWQAWRAAKDVVTALVTVTDAGQPAAGQCLVTAQVRQIVQHTDNTTSPWRTMTVAASMSDTAGGWRLADYRVTG